MPKSRKEVIHNHCSLFFRPFCNTFCNTSEDKQDKANNEQKKSPVFTGFQSLNTGKEKVEKEWE